jgi:cytochrome c5
MSCGAACHAVALAEVIDEKKERKGKKVLHMHIIVCHAEVAMGKPLDGARRLETRFSVVSLPFRAVACVT